MNPENAKTKTKVEQIELLQMKIHYHEKHISTLQKLIERQSKK